MFRSRNICPPQAVPGIKYVNIYKIPPQCPGLQDFKGSEMWASFVPPDPLCSLLRAALYPRSLCMGPVPSDTQPVVREPKEKGNGALTPQLDLCWITLHAGLSFSLQPRFSPVLPSPLSGNLASCCDPRVERGRPCSIPCWLLCLLVVVVAAGGGGG